jgi:hypothetical protein
MVLAGIVLLPCLGQSLAKAVDALDILSRRNAYYGKINLNYQETPLNDVLGDMERLRPGINLKVRAPTQEEEEELLRLPITLRVEGLDWNTALTYLAEKLRLGLDRERENSGLVYLERYPRFSDVFDGVSLGVAVREVASRGNANVIFSGAVDTSRKVYLTFNDVPWREALESILAATGYAVQEEAEGGIIRIAGQDEVAKKMETKLRPLRYVRPDFAIVQPGAFRLENGSPVGKFAPTGQRVAGKTILEILEAVKSPWGSIAYIQRNNTLAITDNQVKIREILDLVAALDLPPAQILLETHVVILDDCAEDENYPQIKWNNDSAWKTGEGKDRIDDAVFHTGTMTLEARNALLEEATCNDSIRLIQAPELLVLDGEEASLFIGDLRSRAGSGKAPVEETLAVGTSLAVTPAICRGSDELFLDVFPQQTGEPIYDRTGAGGIKIDPPLRRAYKAVHTRMLLHSGQTGVISGILDDLDNLGRVKSAGLALSFGLEYAKGKSGSRRVRNTLFMVTPTIILPDGGEERVDKDLENIRDTLASTY